MPPHLKTAGKVTILTVLTGVVVFMIVFLFNVGKTEIEQAKAQSTATTSVTVLNTPPQWTASATELIASATSTPTNSGSVITWVATGTDSNGEPYQLLICGGSNATPTPGTSTTSPTCGAGAFQWAVSPTTTSGTQASAATTTTESGRFAAGNGERFDWYGWICDSIDTNARCNLTFTNGTSSTPNPHSSPWHLNNRPTFTLFVDDSPQVPGAVIKFTSTSSDPDTIGGQDKVKLIVCATTSFNGTTDSCDGTTLATSTFVTSNASATYSVVIPTQDATYEARGYIVDEHGHEASGGSQGTDSVMVISNLAPYITSSKIVLNGGNDLILTQAGGTTTGFTLSFQVDDYNSCQNASAGNEITDYIISVYRSGIGTTTPTGCAGTTTALAASQYNPNNCYLSKLPTTTWNISCTASTTAPGSCGGATDRFQSWDCTFPLWYVADPTASGTASTTFDTQDWRAAVSAVDDNGATTTIHTEGDFGQELLAFLAFSLNTAQIPYGSVEPGNTSGGGVLHATTTIQATGNIGIDQRLSGDHMCSTYTPSTPCPNSATSTIADSNQHYGTSALAYASGIALSSSTPGAEIELNVPKSTSTSTPATGVTYWGIQVPGTITLSGAYTGQNTFVAVAGEPAKW